MDEDNSGTPRVTRARTRRMSALEMDRPVTPQLDLFTDRASPRTTRRTRLNSSTIDLRTPIRTTRLSIARAETPEPVTPPTLSLSTAKRSTRTPANPARKQLTLQEDVKEEAEPTDTKMAVVGEVAEIVESTPPNSGLISHYSSPLSDDRRVTRSMSKTPPVRGRSANNTPINITSSPKKEKKQTKQMADTQVVDTRISEQQTLQSTEVLNEKSIAKAHVGDGPMATDEKIVEMSKTECDSNVYESLVVVTTPKVKVIVKDILIKSKSSSAVKEVNKSIPQNKEPVETKAEKIKDIDEIMPSTEDKDKIELKSPSVDGNEKIEKIEFDSPSIVDKDVIKLDSSIVIDDVGANVTVIDDIRLPDLTPRIMSRVIVGFNDCMHVDDENKPKYPKTPARLNEPAVKNISLLTLKSETPLKRLLKGRNSSTPLGKSEASLSQADEPKQPPTQIDVIQPLSALEDNNNKATDVPITTAKLARRLVNEDEDENEAEDSPANRSAGTSDDDCDEAQDEDDRYDCEFFDTEAEFVEDYQSGDSMNSSERREIEENTIPHVDESVGSQDTPDENSEESADEKMSFIVSDSDGEGDDDDIECLFFSSASEEDLVVPEEDMPKKYRRIVIEKDSSNEDNQINNIENKEDGKESEVTKDKIIKSTNKNKSVSNVEDEEEEQLAIMKPLKVIESEQAEMPEIQLNNSDDVLNKTAALQLSHSDEAMEVDEVLSSSHEETELPKSKKNISCNKSIYEVLASSDDDSGKLNKTDALENNPIPYNLNATADKEKHSQNEEASQSNEKLIDPDDEKLTSTSNNEPSSTESVALNSLATVSDSSTFHEKQKRGEEEALLAEIASCDLSHLQQMFNPLQKSRRQTLYVEDLPVTAKEPKLKRRSVQLNSDVQPSQSFVETLAEQKRQQSKRKRMSKSFCGAADGLDASVVEEVQRKKARKSCDKSETSIDIIEPDVEVANIEELPTAKDEEELPAAKEENKLPAAQMKEITAAKDDQELTAAKDDQELTAATVENNLPIAKVDTNMSSAKIEKNLPTATLNEQKAKPKNRSFYLEYCDSILNAANEAKLQEKKQRVATSNKHLKRDRPASVTVDVIDTATSISTVTDSLENEMPPAKIKKNLKRLQATKQAFSHAVQLLVPETADNNQTQSLARKLSSQPEKTKQKVYKKTEQMKQQQQVSPVKSSDEENIYAAERIRNNAGIVIVTRGSDEHEEYVNTTSGPMKVEPSTPKQKYFTEIPATPEGFRVQPCKKKQKVVHSAATEAALRFKMKMFHRD